MEIIGINTNGKIIVRVLAEDLLHCMPGLMLQIPENEEKRWRKFLGIIPAFDELNSGIVVEAIDFDDQRRHGKIFDVHMATVKLDEWRKSVARRIFMLHKKANFIACQSWFEAEPIFNFVFECWQNQPDTLYGDFNLNLWPEFMDGVPEQYQRSSPKYLSIITRQEAFEEKNSEW